ncbi:flexible cuticle protein 12-like [Onthophagus taurus]|uniref:flexible cuticle protein 12-like n=1 Tax=Onthophagus taurus TaxID=166361 RepID=UPI000C1FE16F|nr:flexible cuticle protein 12-like [Onthophagus taurus]XP_022907039.1 flexible cuticle protein 12-like [Onthophagus taurus]
MPPTTTVFSSFTLCLKELQLLSLNMKTLVILGFLVVLSSAKPQGDEKSATILRFDNENIGVDGYKFGFETSNGIQHDEEGQLQNAGSENELMQARGSFKYTDPSSGKVITVTYTADENGYRPQVSIS